MSAMRRFLAIIVVTAGLGVLSACSATPTETTGPITAVTVPVTGTSGVTTPGATTATTTVDVGTPSTGTGTIVNVYMDGWTAVTLGESSVSLRSGSISLGEGTLVPLDATKIAEMDDVMLAALLNRLVNTDLNIVCVDGMCTSDADSSPIDAASLLADPTQIEGYGASYQAWGLQSGVYLAQVATGRNVDVSDGSFHASVSAGGFSTLRGEGNSDELTFDKNGSLLVFGGLGVLFAPDPLWNQTPDGSWQIRPLVGDVSAGEQSWDQVAKAMLGAAESGLGSTDAGYLFGLLDDTELTFITSPTTGCGSWVVCVPGTIETQSTNVTQPQVGYCAGEDDRVVGVVTFDATTQVTYPHPTHQNGLWNGKGIDEFDHAGPGKLFGVPPLVEGDQTMRTFGALVLDGGDVEGAAPVFVVASRYQQGFDSIPESYTADDAVRASGGTLHTCP